MPFRSVASRRQTAKNTWSMPIKVGGSVRRQLLMQEGGKPLSFFFNSVSSVEGNPVVPRR